MKTFCEPELNIVFLAQRDILASSPEEQKKPTSPDIEMEEIEDW